MSYLKKKIFSWECSENQSIPWNKFNEIVVEWNTGFSIKNWWMCITKKICWDNFIFSITQNTFQWAISSLFNCSTDFFILSLNKNVQLINWISKQTIELTPLLNRAVRSTTDTFGVGTRKAIPVNFPFKSGITLPT